MSAWPNTLPVSPLIDGYSRAYIKHKGVFNPTGGKATEILYYTAVPELLEVSFLLHKSQLTIFDTFYRVTTLFGTQYFTFKDPQYGVTISVRFFGDPPSKVPESDQHYKVSFQLETLP